MAEIENMMKDIKTKLGTGAGNDKHVINFLISKAEEDEDLRSMILDKDKSMSGCMNFIRNKARSKAVSGCACIEDTQVYAWAVEYFGMKVKPSDIKTDNIKVPAKAPEMHAPVREVVPKKKATTKDDGFEGQMDIFAFI